MELEYWDECHGVDREEGVYILKDGRIVTVISFRRNTKGKYPLYKEYRK